MNPFTEMNFVWFECGGIWQDIGGYQFYISSHMLLLLVFILLYYSNSRVHKDHKYTWWCGTAVSVLCGFVILYSCFHLLNFLSGSFEHMVLYIWFLTKRTLFLLYGSFICLLKELGSSIRNHIKYFYSFLVVLLYCVLGSTHFLVTIYTVITSRCDFVVAVLMGNRLRWLKTIG